MKIEPTVEYKIKEIVEELKRLALWESTTPNWVKDYDKGQLLSFKDFQTWLQFIFLPNCLLGETKSNDNNHTLILKAKHLFSDDRSKERLLRLFIELDSLI